MVSRGFVQEIWLEGVPVTEVWAEGVKYYPDARTVVRDLVLGLPADAYWLHAQDAAERGLAMPVLEVNGKHFHLYQGDGTLPVLRWVNGVFRAEADAGLLFHEVLGSVCTVSARVPERTVSLPVGTMCSADDAVELVVLPPLEGTRFEWYWWGNKRHAHGHYRLQLVSPGSGEVYFEEEAYKSGRTGKWGGFAVPGAPAGDVAARAGILYYASKHSGGASNHRFVYPAFDRSWQVEVKGCTLQRIDK